MQRENARGRERKDSPEGIIDCVGSHYEEPDERKHQQDACQMEQQIDQMVAFGACPSEPVTPVKGQIGQRTRLRESDEVYRISEAGHLRAFQEKCVIEVKRGVERVLVSPDGQRDKSRQ
jgi:hypothetical protein